MCLYYDQTNTFKFSQEILRRVLGLAKGEINDMDQWVLKVNGNKVLRRALWPMDASKLNSNIEVKKHKTFDALIERIWGIPINTPTISSKEKEYFKWYMDNDEASRVITKTK